MFVHFVGTLSVRGKRKVRSEDIEGIILKNGGKVISNFGTKFPSEISGTVVTVQREIEKDGSKMTKAILTAYRRKWDFVSPDYVLQYQDDAIRPLEDNKPSYRLNLAHMDSLPNSSLAKVSISNSTHHLLNSRAISAHRVIKKVLREKPLKSTKKENQAFTSSKTSRNVTGYPAFVQQNYVKVKSETGLQEFNAIISIVLERWKKLSPEKRKKYSSASVQSEQSKHQCSTEEISNAEVSNESLSLSN